MMRSIQSQQVTVTAKAQATFDALLTDAFKAAKMAPLFIGIQEDQHA